MKYIHEIHKAHGKREKKKKGKIIYINSFHQDFQAHQKAKVETPTKDLFTTLL